MLASASKLANRFGLNKLHKPEKIANDVKKDLIKFRDYLPIIRSLCNPGLKQRHWDQMNKIITREVGKGEKLSTLILLKVEQNKDKLEEVSD